MRRLIHLHLLPNICTGDISLGLRTFFTNLRQNKTLNLTSSVENAPDSYLFHVFYLEYSPRTPYTSALHIWQSSSSLKILVSSSSVLQPNTKRYFLIDIAYILWVVRRSVTLPLTAGGTFCYIGFLMGNVSVMCYIL